MHLEYWQIGLLMSLAPVGVALLLLVPTAFKMAAGFYVGMAKTAWTLALQRRGNVQEA